MSNTAATTGLAHTALRLSGWAERWFPDAYIIALPNWGSSVLCDGLIALAIALRSRTVF